MRNLKKILALVLALTMVLGLSISASAGTFTDVNEDDDYAAAIELLASLDVLAGMGDGTYNAAGSYTREQFTKILYVLVTGKDDGAAMYTEVAPFPDVAADRWSAGYINWAVQLGILVGRDDGLFHPTDVVNYAEACKMFLIAMGYSASMYTYPYGFIDKADSLKLFDDINGYATYAAANRGTVAQMAYNALFAEAPRYGTYTAKEGDTTSTKTYQLIAGAFKVEPYYAVLDGTSTDAYNSSVYGKDQVDLDKVVAVNSDLKVKLTAGVYNYEQDVDDLIGVQVKVWAHEDEKSLGEFKVVLIEDAGKDKVYTVNPYDVIEINDTEAGRISFKDGEATRRIKIDANTDGIDWEGNGWSKDLSVKANWEDKEVLFRAIDTGNDGDFDDVYVIKPDFARITALSDTKVSVSAGHLVGSNDIMDDDNVVIALEDGLAKDDYVLVFPRKAVIGNSVDDAFAVVKAPVVENVKLTRQSGNTEYDYYADEPMRYVYNNNVVELGNTYNLYLNQNGFIAKAVEIEDDANRNWILATAYRNDVSNVSDTSRESKLFGASIIGYLADGTKKTFSIDIDEVKFLTDKNTTKKTDALAAGEDVLFDSKAEKPGWQKDVENDYILFSYTLNADGNIDSLKYVTGSDNGMDKVENAEWNKGENAWTTKYVDYSTKSTLLKDTDSNVGFFTDATVIYNIDGTDVSVLTADEMADLDLNDEEHWYRQAGIKGGNVRVVVIEGPIAATSYKYGLLVSGIKNDVSSEKANYTIKALIDGQEVELTTKNVDKNGNSTDNLFEGEIKDDALRTKSGDPVIGYARIKLNASGKVTKIYRLNGVTELVNDPDAKGSVKDKVLVDGNAYLNEKLVVTAKPANGKGVSVRGATFLHDPVDGDCLLTALDPFAKEQVLEYASDVAFYTVDYEPCITDPAKNERYDNDADFYAASADSLLVSTLVKGSDEVDVSDTIDSDDTAYAIDVIMAWDDREDKEVVKAVFIYTTPVSGPEDGIVPEQPKDEETIDPVTPKQDTYVDPATGEEKPVKFKKPIVTQPDPEKDEAVITLPVVTSETPANGTRITVRLAGIFGDVYNFYVYNETRRAVDELTEISPADLVLEWNGTGWTVVSPTPMPIYLAKPGAADSLDIVYTIAATNDVEKDLTVPTKLTAKNVTLSATEGKLESGSATLPTVTVNVEDVVANTDYTVTWYLGETKIEGTTTVNAAGEYKAVVEATVGSKVVSGKVELTFTVKGTTGGEVDASLPEATVTGTTITVPYYTADGTSDPAAADITNKVLNDQGITLSNLDLTGWAGSSPLTVAGTDKEGTVGVYTVTLVRYFKVTVGESSAYGKENDTSIQIAGAAKGPYINAGDVAAASPVVTVATEGTVPVTLTKDYDLVAAVKVTAGTNITKIQYAGADGLTAEIAAAGNKFFEVGKSLTVVGTAPSKTSFIQLTADGVGLGEAVKSGASAKVYTYVVDSADDVGADGITLDQTAGFKAKLGTTDLGIIVSNKVKVEGNTYLNKEFVVVTNTTAVGTTGAAVKGTAVDNAAGDGKDFFIDFSLDTDYEDAAVDGIITIAPAVTLTLNGGSKVSYSFGGLKNIAGFISGNLIAEGAELTITASAAKKILSIKVGTADPEIKGTPNAYSPIKEPLTVGDKAIVVDEITALMPLVITDLTTVTAASSVQATLTASNATITEIVWKNAAGQAINTLTAAGTTVTVSFKVTAAAGYTVKGMDNVTTGVSQSAAPVISVNGDVATVTLTFTVS